MDPTSNNNPGFPAPRQTPANESREVNVPLSVQPQPGTPTPGQAPFNPTEPMSAGGPAQSQVTQPSPVALPDTSLDSDTYNPVTNPIPPGSQQPVQFDAGGNPMPGGGAFNANPSQPAPQPGYPPQPFSQAGQPPSFAGANQPLATPGPAPGGPPSSVGNGMPPFGPAGMGGPAPGPQQPGNFKRPANPIADKKTMFILAGVAVILIAAIIILFVV